MSVIGKKPFVNYILDACTDSQVGDVVALLNSLGTPTVVNLQGNDHLITSSNIGITHVVCRLEEISNKVVEGVLIYIDTDHCGLFVFNDSQSPVAEFKINPTTRTYEQIQEHLTCEELRQVCGDRVSEVVGQGDTKTHKYEEGSKLTDTIASEIDAGDIIVVTQGLAFVVAKQQYTKAGSTKKYYHFYGGTTRILNGEIVDYSLSWDSDASSSENELTIAQKSPVKQNLPLTTNLVLSNGLVTATFEDSNTNTHGLYIITIANCFAMTPLSQTGEARGCMSMIVNQSGNTMVVRYKLQKITDGYKITFDESLANAPDIQDVVDNFQIMLIGIDY